MPSVTWNRNVQVAPNIDMPASGGNPPDHPNDTANSITVDGTDRSSGAQIQYNAVGAGLTLTGVSPDGSTTQAELDALFTVSPQTDGDLWLDVKSDAPTGNYQYHVVGTLQVGNQSQAVRTHDPMIHNQA